MDGVTVDNVAAAFAAVPRAEFLPDNVRKLADADMPLPIGFGQTNSQPTTVSLMLHWLEVESGNKILDVGSGSGWTTALLAHLVGPEGEVIAVETVPQLVRFGRTNCQRIGVTNADFYIADTRLGWPVAAPFDRILVSASAQRLPNGLIDQLKNGGRMVIPVHNSVLIVTKSESGEVSTKEISGFAFVPLV